MLQLAAPRPPRPEDTCHRRRRFPELTRFILVVCVGKWRTRFLGTRPLFHRQLSEQRAPFPPLFRTTNREGRDMFLGEAGARTYVLNSVLTPFGVAAPSGE